MSENLQRLLVETNEKSPEAAGEIARIIKKLILIISRPARLLECLEFDPEEFYKLLEAAESQAKSHIASDLPIYIITKLGLNRDPLSDLQSNACEEAKDDKALSKCDINPKTTDLNERFVVVYDLSCIHLRSPFFLFSVINPIQSAVHTMRKKRPIHQLCQSQRVSHLV
jgi:hypothetical protein